jgi:ketosteroid isomerase-like protein
MRHRSPHRAALTAVLLTVLATVFAAAAPAATADAKTGADAAALRQELMDADRAFARSTADKGSEGWIAWFAEDGMIVTAEGPLAKGRKAVHDLTAPFLNDPGVTFTWEPEQAEASAGGDMGWTVGSYRVQATGADGQPMERTGRYVTVWQRQADGSWKVALDADVSAAR